MSTTFKVDDVAVGIREFVPDPMRKALAISMGAVTGGHSYTMRRPNIQWMFTDVGKGLLGDAVHPFVAACTRAYSHHLPLRLSPDHLWTVIVQGLSVHINQQPAAYREVLVSHKNTERVSVRADYLVESTQENWRRLLDDFQQKLKTLIDPVLAQMICAEFSTTGPLETAVYQACLMELLKDFIEYESIVLCGIPHVTLDGEVCDWVQLKERVQMLTAYDLEWWGVVLEPIIDEFIAAAQGNANVEFWRGFVRYEDSCGPHWSGWITQLFPYLFESTSLKSLAKNQNVTHHEFNMVAADLFPAGVSKVPMFMQVYQKMFKMEIAVGFMGSKQDLNSLEVTPQLGWGIYYK